MFSHSQQLPLRGFGQAPLVDVDRGLARLFGPWYLVDQIDVQQAADPFRTGYLDGIGQVETPGEGTPIGALN